MSQGALAAAVAVAVMGPLVGLATGWFLLVAAVLYPVLGVTHVLVLRHAARRRPTGGAAWLAWLSNALLLGAFAGQSAIGDRRCGWLVLLGPQSTPCVPDPAMLNLALFVPAVATWLLLAGARPR